MKYLIRNTWYENGKPSQYWYLENLEKRSFMSDINLAQRFETYNEARTVFLAALTTPSIIAFLHDLEIVEV